MVLWAALEVRNVVEDFVAPNYSLFMNYWGKKEYGSRAWFTVWMKGEVSREVFIEVPPPRMFLTHLFVSLPLVLTYYRERVLVDRVKTREQSSWQYLIGMNLKMKKLFWSRGFRNIVAPSPPELSLFLQTTSTSFSHKNQGKRRYCACEGIIVSYCQGIIAIYEKIRSSSLSTRTGVVHEKSVKKYAPLHTLTDLNKFDQFFFQDWECINST